jgi:hypothetical protein
MEQELLRLRASCTEAEAKLLVRVCLLPAGLPTSLRVSQKITCFTATAAALQADFIVAGRLAAKIDKVAGVVETNRWGRGGAGQTGRLGRPARPASPSQPAQLGIQMAAPAPSRHSATP